MVPAQSINKLNEADFSRGNDELSFQKYTAKGPTIQIKDQKEITLHKSGILLALDHPELKFHGIQESTIKYELGRDATPYALKTQFEKIQTTIEKIIKNKDDWMCCGVSLSQTIYFEWLNNMNIWVPDYIKPDPQNPRFYVLCGTRPYSIEGVTR